MDKRMFKSIMMLILFTVMLILVTVKIDYIMSTIRYIIIILNPLFIGFSIAFVLNRPNMFFIGIYKKLFGRIKRKKFIKPLAICSTYLALIIFCGVLIAFIIPQLTNSVKLFASNAGIYMSGFENYVNNTAQLLHVKNLDLSGFDNVFDSFVASIYDIVIGVIPNLMNITSGVVSVLFTIVLAFVISIYLLSEKETLIRQMKNLTYACVRQVESA